MPAKRASDEISATLLAAVNGTDVPQDEPAVDDIVEATGTVVLSQGTVKGIVAGSSWSAPASFTDCAIAARRVSGLPRASWGGNRAAARLFGHDQSVRCPHRAHRGAAARGRAFLSASRGRLCALTGPRRLRERRGRCNGGLQTSKLDGLVQAGAVDAIQEMLRDLDATMAAELDATKNKYSSKRKPISAALFMSLSGSK